ncbi:unnamed protein product [Brassica oleracea]
MMALHEALRSVCLISSDWIYSVFWTIRLRPYKNTSLLSLSLSSMFIYLSLSLCYLSFCLSLSDYRRVRGGNGFKIGDESDSLMLMWEDGFCGGGGRSEDLFWNQTLKVKILSEKNSARCPFGYTIMEKGG